MINLTFNDINSFKEYLKTNKGKDFTVNMPDRNLFDSIKFIVLSSAYFYQKFPDNKLKIKTKSSDIKSLVSSFNLNNLEFV